MYFIDILINNLNHIQNGLLNGNELRGNPKILTEVDMQSHLFMLIKNAINNLNGFNHFKIHTELADKIPINSTYCGNLFQLGDFGVNQTYTRFTDLTINYDGQYRVERRIRKGFSLNGKYIDLEIKHIRSGDNVRESLPRIRKDLCKIKSLLYPDIEHDVNTGIHPNGYSNLANRNTSNL